MIVIAVIGILVAIVYPSYHQYVSKAKRVAVESEMLEIAASLQRYKAINSTFITLENKAITLDTIHHNGLSPQSGSTLYNLALSNVTAGSWTLTATPVNGQTGDGHVVLNNQGHRCWNKGSDKNSGSACTPSATTNWDGR
ncbi:pilus assembly protein PilE [Acinetobacter sp. NIPH1876]|nr:pilus assembly protein PilE [Acinetobacter sp. NIPH1876]